MKKKVLSKILIIEDDESIQLFVKEFLELEGYEVLCASHGQAALDLLANLNPTPRLILLDFMMPIMNGWEFMAAKRIDPRLKKIPVVALSTLDDSQVATARTDFIIQKPVEFKNLSRAIKQLCVS